MSTKDFLFEIGCEELPPKSLMRLANALMDNITEQLQLAKLDYKESHVFATPRRMAVLITDLATSQENQTIERQGPSVTAAFDKDGTPTLAGIGFARSCGVSADQLQVRNTDKGERLFCEIKQTGKPTSELLPEIIDTALNNLPINKPMRWGLNDLSFVRPVKWLLMLFGSDVVKATFFDKKTCHETYGHRFHHPKAIQINQPREYEQLLQTNGLVAADFDKRKQKIRQQIESQSPHYGKAVIDESLLNFVTALVEWPVVLIGQFKEDFLQVPAEAIITSMKVHQKCFPIVDKQNNLLPYFIMVSNIESKNPQKVIEGNERVINARLADATFFYNKDLAQPLTHFTDKLSHVIFQKKLGTLADRSDRLVKLSTKIAKQLELDSKTARRAAELSKFDLMTDMVGEFPELQGTMGSYYAKNAAETDEVANAIKEHYYPRFSGDQLPETELGTVLALADRLDLLIGILGINKIPTGEKDPYALKRSALGIVRLIVEKSLPLDLHKLLQGAYNSFDDLPNKNVVDQAFQFIMERMRSWYLEQGVKPELFAAVSACSPTKPLDFDQRIKAVQQFQTLPESSSLAAANKRVSNILKKANSGQKAKHINDSLFENDVERKLADLLKQKTESVNNLYNQANYTEALSELATLKEPVDSFFDQVMIMVDDKKVRDNRLALLAGLHHLFTQVADISLLP